MVLRVCNSPRVVRNTEPGIQNPKLTCQSRDVNERKKNRARRVKHPAHAVIDELGLGECLVSTLVCYDPETSGEKTGPETVQRPH